MLLQDRPFLYGTQSALHLAAVADATNRFSDARVDVTISVREPSGALKKSLAITKTVSIIHGFLTWGALVEGPRNFGHLGLSTVH